MTEILGWGAGVFAADSSGGNEEIFGTVEFSCVGFDFESFGDFSDVFDPAVGAPGDARIAGCVGEAVDDGFGGVCSGEHTAVVFGLELDSVALKPSDGIGWLKSVERADEVFVAAWVIFDELARVVAVVSDVAPPTS